MQADLTDITVLLDRSGSMITIQDDTIGGYNAFIDGQKRGPGRRSISLFQFDNELDAVYVGRDASDVPPLTKETFQPRASTALLQAVCEVIDATGARLHAMPESERPAHVIFAIVTDGYENASPRHYTNQLMSYKIAHQRSRYGWEFVYIGANQDAIAVAARMGIDRGKALSYAANSIGTRSAFHSAGKFAAKVSAGVSDVAFDAEDVDLQAKAGVQRNV